MHRQYLSLDDSHCLELPRTTPFQTVQIQHILNRIENIYNIPLRSIYDLQSQLILWRANGGTLLILKRQVCKKSIVTKYVHESNAQTVNVEAAVPSAGHRLLVQLYEF